MTKPILQLISLLVMLQITTVNAAEQLYSSQPSVMPELAKKGTYAVGVQTTEIVNKNAFNHHDFNGSYERKLTVEVWYPTNAKTGAKTNTATKNKATYKAVTRTHQPFEVAGQAYRGAEPLVLKNDETKFPFVVLSHGYTGHRTLMFYLAEHLASHGYVVASIDHTDSTTAEIDVAKAPMAGFISTLIHRSRDQQFTLDYFRSSASPISKITDFDHASVIGYSMGGFGAINTVGGCYDIAAANLIAIGMPKEYAEQLAPVFQFCNAGRESRDPSWKAMVALAPWGQEYNLHQAKSLAELDLPSLYITGDQDDISGYKHGVKKLFEQTSKEDNYLLVYKNARHNVAPHPAPQAAYSNDVDLGHYFEPSWNMQQLNRFNQHFVLAFINCYVKNVNCEYLPTTTDGTQVKKADGSYTKAWPGMPERWTTGVEFHRASSKPNAN